jgi:hypothetical protein
MSLIPGRAGPRFLTALAATTLFAVCAVGQPAALLPDSPAPSSPSSSETSAQQQPPTDKRVLWIIPNYRTSSMPAVYKPISAKRKFDLALADSLDRGTFVLAAAFAGDGQLTKSNPSFGNGVPAYAHYFVTAYADLAIGDMMTEAIYPTLLHQDPRYFRRGTGSGFSRLGYAMGQIFLTHGDSGATQFNYSELAGNATAVAISTAYYPEGRNVSSAGEKLGIQLGVDMASNVLKEFWPDVHKKMSRDTTQSWIVKQP